MSEYKMPPTLDMRSRKPEQDPNADEIISEYEVPMTDYDENMTMFDVPLYEKNRGGTFFQEQNFKEAIDHYCTAIAAINEMQLSASVVNQEKIKQIDQQVRFPCYLNIAVCHLKRQNYSYCIKFCDRALQMNEKNVKALYLKGMALTYSGEYDKGLETLRKAYEIDPQNNDVIRGMQEHRKHKSTQGKNQTEMYKKMLYRPKNSGEIPIVKEENNPTLFGKIFFCCRRKNKDKQI